MFVVASLLAVGCRSSTHTATVTALGEGEIAMLTITSSAFREGETIPKKFTCDAGDTSPDINWAGLPAGTKSLALITDDPDAPGGTWVHWVLFNIPASRTGLAEGVVKTTTVAGVGAQGKNSSGNIGYNGPCPPKGKPHRYFFKVYALDRSLDINPGATKADVENAMRGHILAQGQLIGKYGR
jgi:Raf kinase inhibitor-like YbhB/YbcL family protein